MVCCRAKAATYIGRGGFGFVGRPFRATWWGGVCRAKAATYIGRVGFGFVGRPFRATWWGGHVFCRAKAATYIGRVGFGFVGRPFRATNTPSKNKKGGVSRLCQNTKK